MARHVGEMAQWPCTTINSFILLASLVDTNPSTISASRTCNMKSCLRERKAFTVSELHHDDVCAGVMIREPVRVFLEIHQAPYFAHGLLRKLV